MIRVGRRVEARPGRYGPHLPHQIGGFKSVSVSGEIFVYNQVKYLVKAGLVDFLGASTSSWGSGCSEQASFVGMYSWHYSIL